ncbi:MAG: class F sortase, partial [Candidatus Dormibacteria bacterium]
IPSLNVAMAMLAVGKTGRNLIDAPEGPADDPIWTKAFLFRGGARPGEPGVTTVIGHVDDTRARLDPFANIRLLHPGDFVELVDQRSGQPMRYRITETRVVWEAATHSIAALGRFFGMGAVSQRATDKAADAASGVQRLTMMTCTGQWRGGGFDRRFFAFGVRDDPVAPTG